MQVNEPAWIFVGLKLGSGYNFFSSVKNGWIQIRAVVMLGVLHVQQLVRTMAVCHVMSFSNDDWQKNTTFANI